MFKRLSAFILLLLLNTIFLPASSFAGECAIDAGGNQVQLCIGNTIEGGGQAGGGGPFCFGIRHMVEIIGETN